MAEPKPTKSADKSLAGAAIDIKGKKYVLVSDRIIYFNETYPNGMIETQDISDEGSDRVTINAIVVPDVAQPERRFNARSQAVWGDGYINKTSALENAETSAVGRALAFMGIGVIDSIASVDEIKKAEGQPDTAMITAEQIATIQELLGELNRSEEAFVQFLGKPLKSLSQAQAEVNIKKLRQTVAASASA